MVSQRMQVSRKYGTPPFVGHLRGPPKSVFGLQTRRECEIHPRAPPHEGRCTIFSAGLHPLGDQSGTPFSPKIPKIAKKVPKIGVPPGCYTWPPLLPSCTSIIFFGEPLQAPKWCFFNAVPILGFKKKHLCGAPAGTRKKIIEVQDKKRVKRGYPPFFF